MPGLFCLAVAIGCAGRDSASIAAGLDRQGKTGVYGWLRAHDPARVDVAGIDPRPLAALVPDGDVSRVAADIRQACAAARRDRALLLAIVRRSDRRKRDALQDCGFAVYRDDAAVVIAPL